MSLRLFMLLLCCSAWASTAEAQAGPTVDPRKDAKIRLGPIYVTPTVSLRDVGLDSNVFDSASHSVPDFTATAVPRAEVWVPFAKRALLTTSAAASFVYYRTYPIARSIDPDALVRGDFYARRLTFFAEDRYLKTRERSFEVDAALARRAENAATIGAAAQLGARMSAEVAGYRHQVDYDDDEFLGSNLRESLNRVEDGVRLTVRRKITPLTTVLVRVEAQQAAFEFSPVRDAGGFRISPGVEFSPKALISGSAEVGLRQFSGKSAALPDFRGLVAKAALNYTLLEATQFGVTWNRDAIYSFELLWPYAVVNSVGGRVRRQLRGQVDAIVSVQRATYDFRPFNTEVAQQDRRDVVISYSVDVGYRLSRDSRIGVVATSWNRQSTELLRGYSDFRVGMSFSYGLPRKS